MMTIPVARLLALALVLPAGSSRDDDEDRALRARASEALRRAVRMAFLHALRATGDTYYREAAREAARALVRTQLRSGGWAHQADFDPQVRRRHAYRVDPTAQRQRNWSTLDDDTTQSALRFL